MAHGPTQFRFMNILVGVAASQPITLCTCPQAVKELHSGAVSLEQMAFPKYLASPELLFASITCCVTKSSHLRKEVWQLGCSLSPALCSDSSHMRRNELHSLPALWKYFLTDLVFCTPFKSAKAGSLMTCRR